MTIETTAPKVSTCEAQREQRRDARAAKKRAQEQARRDAAAPVLRSIAPHLAEIFAALDAHREGRRVDTASMWDTSDEVNSLYYQTLNALEAAPAPQLSTSLPVTVSAKIKALEDAGWGTITVLPRAGRGYLMRIHGSHFTPVASFRELEADLDARIAEGLDPELWDLDEVAALVAALEAAGVPVPAPAQ